MQQPKQFAKASEADSRGAVVASQLKAELIARVNDKLPAYDKDTIKGIVDKGFIFEAVADAGVHKVRMGMAKIGSDLAYRSNDHQAAATLITRAAELQARILADAFAPREENPKIGTFSREYLPGDTSMLTLSAHRLEDLERGVNTQLRPKLKIGVEQFRGRG